jgi:hypothetical protein
MHDGIGYVVASYAAAAITLGVWFAMMLRRLRATDQQERTRD